ncbi:hypothetical protein SGRA_1789 [Saprospira grandis str. Lewin]|uniref:Uncharacterized protein n=1 Tax=Saprospira grandis (strain Lewin) TaxID=984262 RepID=H6KZD4_SAPGL|nr:hypothetical protein SGRA_1789 [Saprospira grandis str. Lewin]
MDWLKAAKKYFLICLLTEKANAWLSLAVTNIAQNYQSY